MSSAHFSSDEEVSTSRHTEKEKKMGQKNSILNYFKKSDKPKESQPAPVVASSSNKNNDSPKKTEKTEKSSKKFERAHSSSDEYDESWGRPWKDSAKRNESRDNTPEVESDDLRKKMRSRKKKVRLWRSYSERDTEDYRKGYPGKKDSKSLTENKEFYFNDHPSRPRGDYIDKIHEEWFGNHALLEEHHGYIQWLFPIREQGMNFHAQEFQLHEAQSITSDPTAFARVKKSYKLMLDFYGMKLKNEETGELERADHWRPRFHHLNRSMHNYLRITRILKSLGELGYEKYKRHFVFFVLHEALEEKTLVNCLDSCLDYWVNTIKDDKERAQLKEYAEKFVDFD